MRTQIRPGQTICVQRPIRAQRWADQQQQQHVEAVSGSIEKVAISLHQGAVKPAFSIEPDPAQHHRLPSVHDMSSCACS